MPKSPDMTRDAVASARDTAPERPASLATKKPKSARQRPSRRARQRMPQTRASIMVSGGRYTPLDNTQIEHIHQTALELLESVGLAETPISVNKLILDHGGQLLPDNRLAFPETLVTQAIENLQRNVILHGQQPGHALKLTPNKVHVGTGGAAPQVVDLRSGQYRDSTLKDLYDAARLVDTLDNIQFFSRSLVACDIKDELSLDINTAYAALTGTSKHVMVSASSVASVNAIADMCFSIAGSENQFREKPFLSLNINHAVSPMRLSSTACDVMIEAVRCGIPVHANTFSQLGASSPVTIAGCVAQTVAETLAGVVVAYLANPEASIIFGPRPMITDLRTGGMAGGAGEQALLTAASVQMAKYYGFSNSTIAGATDSKIADAQSGYEKCLNISLAAQTGCNLITQACGMQAGLMACSFESYVIDNDMLGAILRSLAHIDVTAETLSATMVSKVINGDGHYLGQPETMDRMESDFLYPTIADRRTHQEWTADGAHDIRGVANRHARNTLENYYPTHVSSTLDKALRQQYDIRLPVSYMAGSGM